MRNGYIADLERVVEDEGLTAFLAFHLTVDLVVPWLLLGWCWAGSIQG